MEYNIGLCCLYNLISVCINLCPCTPIWYTMFFKSIHPFFSIVNRVILIATCKQKMFRSLKKSILFISIPALKYYWMKKLLNIAKSTLQAKCATPTPAQQANASHPPLSRGFPGPDYKRWHSKFKGIPGIFYFQNTIALRTYRT